MLSEYRLSARVLLRPGDIVRLSGGPYRVASDGGKRRSAIRGLAVIDRLVKLDGDVVIEGAVLSPKFNCRWRHITARITGGAKKKSLGLVDTPYKVSKPRRPPRIEPFPIPIPPRGRRR